MLHVEVIKVQVPNWRPGEWRDVRPVLERGDYLPRSPSNWDSQTVFVDAAYQAKETWYVTDGRTFHPGLHYFVGGNSKVYGAALFRMRERDFEEIIHEDGISPAWPLKYAEFEPYYSEVNVFSTCMASVVRIQPSRPPADRFRILRFRTNPRSRR